MPLRKEVRIRIHTLRTPCNGSTPLTLTLYAALLLQARQIHWQRSQSSGQLLWQLQQTQICQLHLLLEASARTFPGWLVHCVTAGNSSKTRPS
jgi:hypothetical protein